MSNTADIALITTSAAVTDPLVRDSLGAAAPSGVQTVVVDGAGTDRAERVVAAVDPMLREHQAVLILPVDRGAPSLIRKLAGSLHDGQVDLERLLEDYVAARHPLSGRAVEQAQRNVLAKHRLLERYGSATAAEVARQVRSKSANKSQTAYRWKVGGKIFSVPFEGEDWFPAFQFGSDGRPLPVIARVLETLRRFDVDNWGVAFWLTSRNGYLDDRLPVDLLAEDPDAVVDAAQRSYEPYGF